MHVSHSEVDSVFASILSEAVLDYELVQVIRLSKLQQVFTRFLAQAQIDAVCVEP